MRFCCVHDNFISANFPAQPCLLLFHVISRDSKLLLFQLFQFSTKIIHTLALQVTTNSYWISNLFLHYWGTLPIGQKTKSHRYHCLKSVCIRSFSGPYFPAFCLNTEFTHLNIFLHSAWEILRISPFSFRMREITYQKNSEYGYFLRSALDFKFQSGVRIWEN